MSIIRGLCDWWSERRASRGFFSALSSLAKHIWQFLRDSTPARRRQRYGDVDFDWDHRVDTTSATVNWRDRLLGLFHSPYQPTDPALFYEMMESLEINFEPFIFVDLGSGKGRTLMMASDFPFRRILGLELLPDLHRIAEKNLHDYRSEKQRCFNMASICGDARDFEFPSEPTVLYLFNPLPESGLRQVISNLDRSLDQFPRPFYVLYHNPLLESLVAGCSAMQKIGGTHQYSVFRYVPTSSN